MATDKKRTAAGLRWVLPRADGSTWTVDWDVSADGAAVSGAAGELVESRAVGRAAPGRARGMMARTRRTR
jgi:hypothetical protein